ncbi:acyl transferase 4-like [Phragmites australis]|uniref:acyl transferase 4-like n=1 Tax=Phragmites australis TaxID=29695 RepID=UPI002D798C00|nr:acyl transferase 4-like [Phragmites australis]
MGSVGFPVTRTSRLLVAPSSPTPQETLWLSVIDRVAGLRHLVRSLHVFDGAAAASRGEGGEQPAKTLREALGKALVDYYPFAGRFVADEEGEVRVACTGEGAWFVEAVAACSLEEVKHLDHPMLIPKEELLPEPAPDVDPLDMPLMIQVTEFTCGGFVVGLISVHTIADGLGAGQFINAVADYARGLPKPRVPPVWARDLIPDPPKMPAPPPRLELLDLRYFTVDYSPEHIAKVKSRFFESTGQRCSAFDVCVAQTWQARTRALRLEDDEDAARPVHVCFFANTRHLLPSVTAVGFYGNCFYPVAATRGAGEVARADVVEVVRAIRDAKVRLAADFALWAAGGFELDPYELTFTYDTLFVSDWTRLGFLEADYGWGTPANVVPFSYHPFMAVAVIGAPPVPKAGARIMTMCVEERHLPEFQEQMNAFAAGNQ